VNPSSLDVFAVLLVACAAAGQSSPPPLAAPDTQRVVRIAGREISESSARASATISAVSNPVKAGHKAKVHVIFENRSDHDVGFADSIVVFDVRDVQGVLPSETYLGCVAHFFSPCYKEREAQPVHDGAQIQGPTPPLPPPIAPHKKLEWDQTLNEQYDLSSPGTYVVFGYVHILDEDGEDAGTFKTNKIKFEIQ
jgi:hypothetical protein